MTLTHVSFPQDNNYISQQALLQFLQDRFPNLNTFILGSFSDGTSTEFDEALTSFLLVHSTIETLSLGFNRGYCFTPYLQKDLLQQTMLPRLRILRARADVVARLAYCGLASFTRLTTLATGHGYAPGAMEDVGVMVSLFQRNNGIALSSLQHLQFSPGDVYGDRSVKWIQECLSDLSEIAPNVTRLAVIGAALEEVIYFRFFSKSGSLLSPRPISRLFFETSPRSFISMAIFTMVLRVVQKVGDVRSQQSH